MRSLLGIGRVVTGRIQMVAVDRIRCGLKMLMAGSWPDV